MSFRQFFSVTFGVISCKCESQSLIDFNLQVYHSFLQVVFHKWLNLQLCTFNLLSSKIRLSKKTFPEVMALCTWAIVFQTFFFVNAYLLVFFCIMNKVVLCLHMLNRLENTILKSQIKWRFNLPITVKKSHIKIIRKSNSWSAKAFTLVKSFYRLNFLSSVNKSLLIPSVYRKKTLEEYSIEIFFAYTL